MTRAEAITFALQYAGGIGVAASLTMLLLAVDGGGRDDAISALRLFCTGCVALLAAREPPGESAGKQSRLP